MPDYKYLRRAQGLLGTFNSDPGNAFENYDESFDYDKASGILDRIVGQQKQGINGDFTNNLASARQNKYKQLASRGITGGSMLDSQLNDVTNTFANARTDAISSLDTARLGQEPGLMEMESNVNYRNTAAKQQAQAQRLQSIMQQYGLMGQLGISEAQLQIQEDAQEGSFWDDILGAIPVVGNLVDVGMKLFGGSGSSAAGAKK